MELFKQRLIEAIDYFDNNPNDYHMIRFEPPFYPTWIETEFGEQVSENIFECDKIFGSHCHLINENSKEFFMDLYEKEGWTSNDDWFNFNFADRGLKLLTFKELLTFQFDGFSNIEGQMSDFDPTIKKIKENIKNNL